MAANEARPSLGKHHQDAQDGPADLSSAAHPHLAAFHLVWAFRTLSEFCLLGVIWCALEKTSTDHNLKTGRTGTAKGWPSC